MNAAGRSAAVLGLFVGALLVSACAHQADVERDTNSSVAPFTQTRNQTVALVTSAKHSLGASDMNQLAVTYGALEATANGYARFLVESARVTSFDAGRNAKYAASLTDAIAVFNHAFVALRTTRQGDATVPSAWIPVFAESLEPYWNRYHSTFAAASPQTRAAFIERLTSNTVWPNFEDIATESLSAAVSH
jgi:hypothetical protein